MADDCEDLPSASSSDLTTPRRLSEWVGRNGVYQATNNRYVIVRMHNGEIVESNRGDVERGLEPIAPHLTRRRDVYGYSYLYIPFVPDPKFIPLVE